MNIQQKEDDILTCSELSSLENNSFASVAGFVIVKQMPSTAKGTVFLTLEDETGTSNVICWNNVYRKFRDQIVFSSKWLLRHRPGWRYIKSSKTYSKYKTTLDYWVGKPINLRMPFLRISISKDVFFAFFASSLSL